jgi:hypothetical protein
MMKACCAMSLLLVMGLAVSALLSPAADAQGPVTAFTRVNVLTMRQPSSTNAKGF